jgi:hypothetical protein
MQADVVKELDSTTLTAKRDRYVSGMAVPDLVECADVMSLRQTRVQQVF